MFGNIVCVAAVLLGIDAGWQSLPDGGIEYLIQIEPHVLETLKSGEPLRSDIPPYVKDIRSYRITVGTDDLPRELPPEPGLASPNGLPPDPFPSPSPPPSPIQPDPGGKPSPTQPAVHLQQKQAPQEVKSTLQPEPTGKQEPNQDDSSKPWMPLTLALFGLFASLGLNGFLFWIAADFRSRYRALLRRIGEAAAP